MCGICLVITTIKGSLDFPLWLEMNDAENILRNRGPDSFNFLTQSVDSDGISFDLHAAAGVLSMRGLEIAVQPITNDYSDFLLFNGEIYGGFEFDPSKNDGVILLEKLSNFSDDLEMVRFVTNLIGPRSFIYFNNRTKKLWINRDHFGRCSLLWSADANSFTFCSTKPPESTSKWAEMPSGCLICVDFSASRNPKELLQNLLYFEEKDVVRQLIHSYYNVTSFNLISNERMFKINDLLPSEDDLTFGDVDNRENLMKILLISYENYVAQFLVRLRSAVKQRLHCMRLETPYETNICTKNEAKLAILFSGGVDSLLLAAIIGEIYPENRAVDLLNVAFEQSVNRYDVPDRQTGFNSLSELRNLNKNRIWNFVQIDVSQDKLKTKRKERISNLIYPCQTVLDDSIGCSLWFAARGSGTLEDRPYRSRARAIVVGSGADELLAGYSRHRKRFDELGWTGLIDELKMELRRLPSRNLGRDDRVMADHGREPHAPYLDENFVEFCNSLPINVKTNLNLPRGVGEKLILRLALWHLGFRRGAIEPKRAMQFGTRIAKSESRKERGNELCSRLTS